MNVFFTGRTVRVTQSPDVLFHGDLLTISCTMSYNGSMAPEFIWHPTPEIIPPPSESFSSTTFRPSGTFYWTTYRPPGTFYWTSTFRTIFFSTTLRPNTRNDITSTIQVTAPAYPGSVPPYTCHVGFDGSVFPSADNQTSTEVHISGA